METVTGKSECKTSGESSLIYRCFTNHILLHLLKEMIIQRKCSSILKVRWRSIPLFWDTPHSIPGILRFCWLYGTIERENDTPPHKCKILWDKNYSHQALFYNKEVSITGRKVNTGEEERDVTVLIVATAFSDL